MKDNQNLHRPQSKTKEILPNKESSQKSFEEFFKQYTEIFYLNEKNKNSLGKSYYADYLMMGDEKFHKLTFGDNFETERERLTFENLISDKFNIIGSQTEIERIKYLLKKIYQTTDGQKLIESLLCNPKVTISINPEEFVGTNKRFGGLYREECIFLKNGDVYCDTLFHELIHERQRQENVTAENALSEDDAQLINIMQEMEAKINTSLFLLKHYFEKHSDKMHLLENDVAFQEYLKQKKLHPNLNIDKLIPILRTTMSMRFLNHVKKFKREADKLIIRNPDFCMKDIKSHVMKSLNKNMSKSDKKYFKNAAEWLLFYRHQFKRRSENSFENPRIKRDSWKIFNYYKKYLNIDIDYEKTFKELFDKVAQFEQVDDKTANILNDGQIIATIEKLENKNETRIFYKNSNNIRIQCLECLKHLVWIRQFDKKGNLYIQEKYRGRELIEKITYSKNGKISSEIKYEDGKKKTEIFYNENGIKTSYSEYKDEYQKDITYNDNGEKLGYTEHENDILRKLCIYGPRGKIIDEMEYDAEGRKTREASYNNSGKILEEKFFHKNEKVSESKKYENGKVVEDIFYREDGTIEKKIFSSDNNTYEYNYDEKEKIVKSTNQCKDGIKFSYAEYEDGKKRKEILQNNGKKILERDYDGDEKTVRSIYYDENEKVFSECLYGKCGILFETFYRPDGSLSDATTYSENGEKEKEVDFYRDGTIKTQAFFGKGECLEKKIYFNENGIMEKQLLFNKDETITRTDYDENKNVVKEVFYDKDGKEMIF